MGMSDGCVRWACQMGVSDGHVRWVCQMGMSDGRVRWVCQMGVSDGRVRWACQMLSVSCCRAAVYAGIQLVLVTNTMKGVSPMI